MDPKAFELYVLSDGTLTTAEIVYRERGYHNGRLIGRGEARRRPGDPRDRDLGETIAMQRAFQDAAFRLGRALSDLGYED
jgi:hypothetical protein